MILALATAPQPVQTEHGPRVLVRGGRGFELDKLSTSIYKLWIMATARARNSRTSCSGRRVGLGAVGLGITVLLVAAL